ncbi:MAG TPA: shikimate kinase [Candidatus Saccharimonadales bacterium]|nr:shikimate kinase [Candidatus Saccharimonadales bacterium]
MKIVLIGFMGSGKTEVGKTLAKKLAKTYREMDLLLLKKSEEESINDIFEKSGEIRFRELEIEVAKDLQDEIDTIIATGGGVVMNKIIIDYLRQNNGILIYLRTSFDHICERLQGDMTRPLFKDKVKAKELYSFREPLYKHYADIIIDTENKTVDSIVDELADTLKL